MKKIILLFCILSCYLLVNAQSGFPDPSFGNNGFISTYPAEAGTVAGTSSNACLILPDGKFILVLLDNKTILTRRFSNGDIDASYGNNGYSVATTMIPKVAAMQGDGKIVVAGNTNGTTDFMLARYNSDGTLDASFGNGGVIITDAGLPTDFLQAVVVTTTGKIIVGGITILSGHEYFVLAQYTSSGQIDGGFGNNGFVLTDFNNSSSSLSSLVLQPDGKIVASGVVFINNQRDMALARYNADGSLDLSFNQTGKTTANFSNDDWGRSVQVNNDGKIYVGGTSIDASGYRRFTIARFNSDGLLDLNFNAGSGFVRAVYGPSTDNLVNIRIQNDGKIVAAGHCSPNDEDFDVALVRINTDGSIDNSFGTNGNGRVLSDLNDAQENCAYVEILADNKIFAGGSTSVIANTSTTRFACFRYNADGTPDGGFGNAGVFTGFFPRAVYNYWAIFQQNDGKILTVSESNNETVKQFTRRFNSNGSPDNSYGQNGIHELNYVSGLPFFQPDGKIVRLSYSPANNGDIMLVRNNSDGTPDGSFGNGGTVITDFGGNESGAANIAFAPDGKIVVGGLSRDNNGSDFLVVRYNANGTVDGSFGNGGSVKYDFKNTDQVQSIAIAPNGKIVFGGMSLTFPPFFDRLKFYGFIGRLNPDGSFDTNFGEQGKVVIDKSDYDNIGNVLVQNDNKVVYTRFGNSTGQIQDIFIGRLNVNGSLDNSFGQNGESVCDGHIIFQQIDQKILILGAKKNNRYNTDFTLTRLSSPDGTPDLSFGTNGKTTISFTQLDNFFYSGFLSGNSFFVAGGGVDVMGLNVGLIAKFGLDPEVDQSISCPSSQVVNTEIDLCGARVYAIDPIAIPGNAAVNYGLSGATTGIGIESVSGLLFNTGVTAVTYTLTGDPAKSCSFNVTVQDNQAPVIADLGVSQASLWPPNHKLEDITVNYSVSDNCEVANTVVTISSNEPVQGTEKHDESPDWQILDNHHIRLRAERLGSGDGRIYSIKVSVTDVNGNQHTATTTVVVPKSQRNSGQKLVVTASPNPSSGYFLITINSNSNEKVRVRLLDNRGTVLRTMNNVSAQQTLEIGDELKAGIYFLEVVQSGVKEITRVVKQ